MFGTRQSKIYISYKLLADIPANTKHKTFKRIAVWVDNLNLGKLLAAKPELVKKIIINTLILFYSSQHAAARQICYNISIELIVRLAYNLSSLGLWY